MRKRKSKSESLLYSIEISSIETKICSKIALKSKTNQNLQKNWKNGQSKERNPMREALLFGIYFVSIDAGAQVAIILLETGNLFNIIYVCIKSNLLTLELL